MRRDNRGPRGTFGNKAPSPNDDGSGGRWASGLPTDRVPDIPKPSIDYDAQAGTPREQSGGTYRGNVNPPKPAPRAPDPKPFKVK